MGDGAELAERDAVAAKLPKPSGMARPEMVLPPLTTKAAPENIVSVASVATNGRMPTRLTSTPLKAPPSEADEERDRDRGPDRIAERRRAVPRRCRQGSPSSRR